MKDMRCDCCGGPIFDKEPSRVICVPNLCDRCNASFVWGEFKTRWVGKEVPDFAETYRAEEAQKTRQVISTRNRPAELENNSWDGYPKPVDRA